MEKKHACIVPVIILFLIGATFVLIPRDVRITFQKDEWKASLISKISSDQFYFDKNEKNFVIETEIPLLIENDNYVSVSGQATTDIFYLLNRNVQVKIGTVTIELDIPPRSSSTILATLSSTSPSVDEIALISLQMIEDCSGCVMDFFESKISQIFGNDERSGDVCSQSTTFYTEVEFSPNNIILSVILDKIFVDEEVEIGCKDISL